MSKYDEIPFKNNIKQLVNVALMVTKLNKHKFETNDIPAEVILHEQTHAKQKHSLDIIILELLQIALL